MSRPRKQPPTPTPLRDPVDMTAEERLDYITKLESALNQTAKAAADAGKSLDADWQPTEKRPMLIPAGPTGEPIRLNGKAYAGRQFVTKDEFDTLMEIYFKAMKSELQRMQQRGNLVPPHLLAPDDITSRTQSQLVAAL